MTQQGEEVEAIFLVALDKTTVGERLAYVEQACGGRPQLLERVRELLKAHQDPRGPLDAPPPGVLGTTDQPGMAERPGTVIGPYKLLEQIGEGGFGVVFVAEQQEPIRRKVALKVLKPGMDTRQVIARFEAERQALALMDHPNIAHVLDAGATSTGRPYVVMELVKGVPITDFCNQESLAPRQRLDLFVHVCQAVQHAHQKGIIHRDLKPTNVLVTLHDGTPVVKVIDFGIAKALGQQLTDKTLYTGFAQLLGTPLYMSPEQAALSGLDVDTRSDIYSLGVLLYELLTGTTPFDQERLRAAGYEEMRRIIREEEPPRPSMRLSTLDHAATLVSGQRRSDPKRLSQLCRGELDWIVMKALEKDRGRRYESASALAQDIERYLHDEPVQASPPSRLYRLRKGLRRHRGAAVTAAAFVGLLLAGAAVSTWLAVRAMQAEGNAVAGWADADEQRIAADANVQKALAAERARTQQLGQAKLAQAEAGRWSGRAGRVFDSLQALAEAAQIARSVNAPEEYMLKLRNVAIACMALPDLRRRPEFDKYTAEGTGGAMDSSLQQYATSDEQGTITIARIRGDQVIARLRGVGTRASAMVFSPDGRFLAAVYPRDPQARRGQVFIWDLGRREIALRLPPEVADPGLHWGPDSRRLAVDYRSPQTYRTGPPPTASSPNSPNSMIAVYDVDSHKELQRFPAGAALYGLAFDPSGGKLAVLAPAGAVKIRDVETGKLVSQFSFPAPTKRFAWGCDGRFLAAAYAEPPAIHEGLHVYLWNVPAGRLARVLEGHRNIPIHVAFNRAGDLLASNSWDNTLRLWNPWTGKELLRTESWWGALQFSPDDRFLLENVGWSGARHCWEIKTGQEYRQLYTPAKDTLSWGLVTFSPDGRLLAAECTDGIRLWDVRSGKPLARLSPTRGDNALSFEAGGKGLVTRGSVGDYRWPLSLDEDEAGHKLRIGPPEKLPAEDPSLAAGDGKLRSPDGKWAVANSAGGVTVWDARSGQRVGYLTKGEGIISFSPDGKWLVTGSQEEYAFWQVGSWRPRHRIPRELRHPAHLAFTRDGKLVALATTPWDIGIVDPATGRELASLASPEPRPMPNFAFSPDGTRLAVATRCNFLELWDLRAIRRQLAAMGLDWDLPYPAPAPSPEEEERGATKPLQVQADLGHMVAREKYSLVLAFFPFHAEAYYQRGLAYLQFGQLAAAFDDLNSTLLLKPDHAAAYHYRAMLLASQRHFEAAMADFSRAIALRLNYAEAYAGRAYTHLQLEQYREAVADFSKAEALGHWDKAAADFAEAVAGPNPGKAIVAYWLALARLGASDLAGYRRACAGMARRFGRTEDRDAAFWLAWAGVLGPDALADSSMLVRSAEGALAPSAKGFDGLNTLGAALYRAARFKEALLRLQEAQAAYNPADWVRQPIVYNWLFQAMAHHALGHDKEARKWLQKAVGWMDEVAQDKGGVPMPWNRRLTLRLLRREAEALIGGVSRPAPSADKSAEKPAPSAEKKANGR
jgi:serine/threonine protein kinase/WD40 repeat protein